MNLLCHGKGSTFMHDNGTFNGISYTLWVQFDNVTENSGGIEADINRI